MALWVRVSVYDFGSIPTSSIYKYFSSFTINEITIESLNYIILSNLLLFFFLHQILLFKSEYEHTLYKQIFNSTMPYVYLHLLHFLEVLTIQNIKCFIHEVQWLQTTLWEPRFRIHIATGTDTCIIFLYFQ